MKSEFLYNRNDRSAKPCKTCNHLSRYHNRSKKVDGIWTGKCEIEDCDCMMYVNDNMKKSPKLINRYVKAPEHLSDEDIIIIFKKYNHECTICGRIACMLIEVSGTIEPRCRPHGITIPPIKT